LCKNIEVEERTIRGTKRRKIKTQVAHAQGRALRQADYSWNRSSYICKAEPINLPVHMPSHARGSNGSDRNIRVTFICFGSPEPLERRLEQMCQHWDWKEALREPYIIFHVVLDELYQQIHEMSGRLSSVFGDMEHVCLFITCLLDLYKISYSCRTSLARRNSPEP